MKCTRSLFVIAVIFTLSTTYVCGQEESEVVGEKNHIQFNALGLILDQNLEVSYDRNLSGNVSIGIGVMQGLGKRHSGINTAHLQTSVKYYISKKYAQGFFIEGFARYINDRYRIIADSKYRWNRIPHSEQDVAIAFSVLGFGLGSKFILDPDIHVIISADFAATTESNVKAGDVITHFRGGIGYRF